MFCVNLYRTWKQDKQWAMLWLAIPDHRVHRHHQRQTDVTSGCAPINFDALSMPNNVNGLCHIYYPNRRRCYWHHRRAIRWLNFCSYSKIDLYNCEWLEICVFFFAFFIEKKMAVYGGSLFFLNFWWSHSRPILDLVCGCPIRRVREHRNARCLNWMIDAEKWNPDGTYKGATTKNTECDQQPTKIWTKTVTLWIPFAYTRKCVMLWLIAGELP